jgi:hypothetical protein
MKNDIPIINYGLASYDAARHRALNRNETAQIKKRCKMVRGVKIKRLKQGLGVY